MADKTTAGANATLTAMLTGATVHLYVSSAEVGIGLGYSSQAFGTVTPSGGTASNLADINFGTSTSSWGSIDEIVVKTSGAVIYMRKTITPTAVASGKAVKLLAGDLDVTETLCSSTHGEACLSLLMSRRCLTAIQRHSMARPCRG